MLRFFGIYLFSGTGPALEIYLTIVTVGIINAQMHFNFSLLSANPAPHEEISLPIFSYICHHFTNSQEKDPHFSTKSLTLRADCLSQRVRVCLFSRPSLL